MSHVFGIPVATLLAIVVGGLVAALLVVAVLGLRNRVFLRLGVRNVGRRPARSALIIAGSMLGTAIIAAALTTGDTMSQTIRSSATAALGRTDEIVAARGVDTTLAPDSEATGARYFPVGYAERVARAVAGTGTRSRGSHRSSTSRSRSSMRPLVRTSRASRCSPAILPGCTGSATSRAAARSSRSRRCDPARST